MPRSTLASNHTAIRTIHPASATIPMPQWLKPPTTWSNASTAEETILLETANSKSKSETLVRSSAKTKTARLVSLAIALLNPSPPSIPSYMQSRSCLNLRRNIATLHSILILSLLLSLRQAYLEKRIPTIITLLL